MPGKSVAQVHEILRSGACGQGQGMVNFLALSEEKITATCRSKNRDDGHRDGDEKGIIRKTEPRLKQSTAGGIIALGLEEGDK